MRGLPLLLVACALLGVDALSKPAKKLPRPAGGSKRLGPTRNGESPASQLTRRKTVKNFGLGLFTGVVGGRLNTTALSLLDTHPAMITGNNIMASQRTSAPTASVPTPAPGLAAPPLSPPSLASSAAAPVARPPMKLEPMDAARATAIAAASVSIGASLVSVNGGLGEAAATEESAEIKTKEQEVPSLTTSVATLAAMAAAPAHPEAEAAGRARVISEFAAVKQAAQAAAVAAAQAQEQAALAQAQAVAHAQVAADAQAQAQAAALAPAYADIGQSAPIYTNVDSTADTTVESPVDSHVEGLDLAALTLAARDRMLELIRGEKAVGDSE
ncbi:hypothetical protein T492DRAFT_848020 [Pavlovales sp. CCMP2436]|nr:hypothetical protein T492DRAFT_848020 [Pavlovales sp. CCMP2436]